MANVKILFRILFIMFTPTFLNIIIDFIKVKLHVNGMFRSGNKDDNRRITITEQYGDVQILLGKEISVEELRDFPGSVLRGFQESRFARGIDLKPMFFQWVKKTWVTVLFIAIHQCRKD